MNEDHRASDVSSATQPPTLVEAKDDDARSRSAPFVRRRRAASDVSSVRLFVSSSSRSRLVWSVGPIWSVDRRVMNQRNHTYPEYSGVSYYFVLVYVPFVYEVYTHT